MATGEAHNTTTSGGRRRPRLLIVARDLYPPFRVDLTELFSVFLGRWLDLTWMMRRDDYGPAVTIEATPHERFIVPSRTPGRLRGVRTRLSYFWTALTQVANAVTGRWDLVQVRDIPIGGVWFLFAALIARKPFVYWMSFPVLEGYRDRARNPSEGDGLARTLYRWAYYGIGRVVQYGIMLRLADFVFVQSEIMAADVAAKGIRPDRIMPVPMAVNVSRYNPEVIPPARDPRLEGRKVLVYVGSLEPQRQPVMLIEALAIVARDEPSALLVFVGDKDPETTAPMAERAKSLGVEDRILYTGRLPLKDTLAYVARADVCLALYPVTELLISGTPTKLGEYLAMGRPVVGNPHPYQSRLLETTGAGIIAEMNAEAFAAAILAVLRGTGSAAERAAAAPAWIRDNLSYEVTAERVGRVYARLLGVAPP
jgi:glycosyltransferase involved in cell wall biosynthesis